MDAQGNRRRSIVLAVAAIAGLVVLMGPALNRPSPSGRFEVGSPIPGVVALVDGSAPESDPFNGQFCGGVVVAERRILTAAHCMANRAATETDVIGGADNLCRGRAIDGARARVVASRLDERWDAVSARFDLAWLTVDRDVGPATAVAVPETVIGDATAFGWGAPRAMANAPCRLSATTVRIREQAGCPSLVGSSDRSFDPDSMLCAAPTVPGEDTCGGDSGGPLFLGQLPHLGGLAGIVSWGRGCGQGFAGVYARLANVAVTGQP